MGKIASEEGRNLFLTASRYGARFRPAAKWFTHRTSLAWLAKWTAERSWGRSAAMAGVTAAFRHRRVFLRQLVRDYSLKRKIRSACVATLTPIASGERSLWGQ
jgi:hypothetical protein